MIQDLFADQPDSSPRYAGSHAMHPHPCGVGYQLELPDGQIHYAPGFLSRDISDRLLQTLLANSRYPEHNIDWQQADITDIQWHTIPWRQDSIHLYGKQVPLPRLSSWHGDSDRPYTYSGLTLQPNPWNKPLDWLRDQLAALTGIRFNSVLLNWYRSGEDHISWHTDAEAELGQNPVIASINLGVTRRFLLRRRDNPQDKLELPLGHGTLLVMSGALQHHWQHSVPKEKRIRQSRVNLTFRVIHAPACTG